MVCMLVCVCACAVYTREQVQNRLCLCVSPVSNWTDPWSDRVLGEAATLGLHRRLLMALMAAGVSVAFPPAYFGTSVPLVWRSSPLPVGTEEVQVKRAAAGDALTGWRTTVPLLFTPPSLLIIAAAQTLISITLRLLWQVVLEGEQWKKKKTIIHAAVVESDLSLCTVMPFKWLIFHLEQSGNFSPFFPTECAN